MTRECSCKYCPSRDLSEGSDMCRSCTEGNCPRPVDLSSGDMDQYTVSLRKEGAQWVAILLEHFIAAQGTTPEQALEALSLIWEMQDQTISKVATIAPAPDDLLNETLKRCTFLRDGRKRDE